MGRKRANSLRPCIRCNKSPGEAIFGTVTRRGRVERTPACKACLSKARRDSYAENPGIYQRRQRIWDASNPGYLEKWRKHNPDKVKRQRQRHYRSYVVPRMRRDPMFRVLVNMRKYLSALVGCKKSAATRELVGCTLPCLKEYLEKKFSPGMSWNNYGKWHLDHVKPCALFDFSVPAQQKECFHYTNLQPLWAKDNLSKKATYVV